MSEPTFKIRRIKIEVEYEDGPHIVTKTLLDYSGSDVIYNQHRNNTKMSSGQIVFDGTITYSVTVKQGESFSLDMSHA